MLLNVDDEVSVVRQIFSGLRRPINPTSPHTLLEPHNHSCYTAMLTTPQYSLTTTLDGLLILQAVWKEKSAKTR